MKHLAAYCLLVLSGKAEPTEQDITKLLKDVGANVDKDNLAQMLKALKGKKLHDLVRDGSKKLVAGGAVGGAGTAAPAGDKPAGKKDEKKAEEKKAEVVEEANVDMGGLFGDDY